jgi:hypothetical protein
LQYPVTLKSSEESFLEHATPFGLQKVRQAGKIKKKTQNASAARATKVLTARGLADTIRIIIESIFLTWQLPQ